MPYHSSGSFICLLSSWIYFPIQPLVDSPRSSPKFHAPPPPLFSPPVTPATLPLESNASQMPLENAVKGTQDVSDGWSDPPLKAKSEPVLQINSSPVIGNNRATAGMLRPPQLFGDSEDVSDNDAPPDLPASLPPDLHEHSDAESDASAPAVPPSFLDSPTPTRTALSSDASM